MGVVYLGHDPDMERSVAVKTLKPDAPDEIKQRFAIEGKAGKLQNDNIVTIYETGHWNGDVPYIAMEYIDGEPLDHLVASRQNLPLIEKLEIIRQVCEGLDYAHLNRVVHRDIKPGNIIRRRDGRVKIVDFGIARVQSSLTMTGMTGPLQVIGTLAYMAPERLKGERGDGRIDIFATGVMLYYLLTGKEPFTGDEPQSVMHKLISEPHPPLNTYLVGYPEALDQILDRALAKDPEDRYSTAQEFSADLAAVIDELNRGRIAGLLSDCQRLGDEGNFQASADRAREVLRIDPQNAIGRELLRKAQRGMDYQATVERLRNLTDEAEHALAEKRFDQAIRAYEEIARRRPGDTGVQKQLEAAREKRKAHQLKESLRAEAITAQQSGDLTGAVQRYEKALQFDPEDLGLREEYARVQKELREQEERTRANRLIQNAKQKLRTQSYTDALAILDEIRKSHITHSELDVLYNEALIGRQHQDTERRREQVITQVRKLRLAEQFPQALVEIDHGLDDLQNDTTLLRLKQEIEREAKQSELAGWIAQTVDRVLNQALSSLDDALATLHKAMERLPGEERFEALEADLLKRKREAGTQQRRSACLRSAVEALHADQAARAIQIVENYLLEFQTDTEIDGFLQDARRALAEQQARSRIAESAAQARTLVEEQRFTQAIALLQPLVAETKNRGLETLLERAEQGKAELDARLRLLAKRVADLRREGKLAEAVALMESQPAQLIQTPLVQDLFLKLREELKEQEAKLREESARKEALRKAIAHAQALLDQGQWASAREPLDNCQRVFGESDALAQALAEFNHNRSVAADAQVSRSVDEAKAALLTGDRLTARKALDTNKALVPFASAGLVAEWDRLAKLPNFAAAAPAPEVTELVAEPKRSNNLWLPLGAVAVALLGGVAFYLVHGGSKPVPAPQSPASATIASPAAAPGGVQKPTEPQPPVAQTAPSNLQPTPSAPDTTVSRTPPVDKAAKEVPKPPPPSKNAAIAAVPALAPTPAAPPPAEPVVEFFRADAASIAQGSKTTLRWKVSNASKVEIQPEVGNVAPTDGYVRVDPSQTTTYRIVVDGTPKQELIVAVTAPPPPPAVATAPAAPAPKPTSVSTPPKPSGPERPALLSAVKSFQGVLGQAFAKKEKECKQSLGAAGATPLSSLCGFAARVDFQENCNAAPTGTDDSATLTCAEDLSVRSTEGLSTKRSGTVTFHFSKDAGSPSWHVTRYERNSGG
jgi:serine/threonine-protein kinase